MENAADLFIPFILTSFAAGIVAAKFFCMNLQDSRIRPLYFGFILVFAVSVILGSMTFEIAKLGELYVLPKNVLAFGMLFSLSSFLGACIVLAEADAGMGFTATK